MARVLRLYEKIKVLPYVVTVKEEMKKNIHILGISEAHLNADISDSQASIQDHTFVRGCYIRNDIHWQRREDLEQKGIEARWIEILVKNSKSFLVCIIHRPTDSSKYSDRNFEEKFDDMITTIMVENKETIVARDMNCNYLDQLNNKAIENTLKLNGFKQVINEATNMTTKTSTLNDVTITTDEQRISNQIVIANAISDHDLTGAIRKMYCQKFKPRKIYSRSHGKYNPEEFKKDLRELPWEKVIKEKEVKSAWHIFKQLLSSVIDKHAPYKEKIVRGRDCPWLTHEIRGKINELNYLLKKARRSIKENNWSAYRRGRNSVTAFHQAK